MRIGFGYDSHRFDAARPLILGGVRIEGAPGLAGHSDGDAIAHAVTDALLGATALGDIGRHFPPSDSRWKDADSIDLLRRAVALLKAEGYAIGNVDVTVVTERVRIAPHALSMREALAAALDIPVSAVSVKGKTNEGMGWTGEGVGLAAYAVALVRTT
ncbi:MAG: 2-C-methyl-D-erythritol 2,4-cyclodiphosphate synthase [Gemmatimonadota bacterium]